MDPNANLTELRGLVTKLRAEFTDSEDPNAVPDGHDVDRVLELIGGLDDWLSKGGALPKAWKHQPFESMGG